MQDVPNRAGRFGQQREAIVIELLERQKRLTINQWELIATANLADLLDFFDFSHQLRPCFHHQGMAATRFCFLESAMLLFNVCEHDTYQESDVCRRHRAC